MSQDAGQRFDVHSAGEGMGCKGVPEIMKPDVGQSRLLQQSFQVRVCGAWIGRLLRL